MRRSAASALGTPKRSLAYLTAGRGWADPSGAIAPSAHAAEVLNKVRRFIMTERQPGPVNAKEILART
ncbi:hypothetical protein G6F64_015644 [Rhizopus arrhizus]|uniref:Uncharacterized protein n=1 Tax=Rhizopus oryzae TaxID=64495 RepID=A0A9P6WRJ9_RHIOR|nr:hypothetical protein G6F64_015644 [Rhizopus arrhizus]